MNLRDRLLLQPWAINFEYALSYSSAIVAILEGKDPFPTINKSKWRQRNKTRFISADDDMCGDDMDDDDDDNDELIDPDDDLDTEVLDETTVSEGSVAHMKLRGPVVKYNQFCGPRGTVDYAQELISLANDPNVIGGVFEIESGGGEYYAVKPLADAIKYFESQKPLLILGGDFLCSAAYYLALYGTELWFQHPKAIIGSIGTMISYADMRPYFEKMGVVFHDVYATDSSLKNKTTTELLKGNYTPMRNKMLNPINDDFKADVVSLRGSKLSADKTILQGETFFGTAALELGMVDRQGTLKEAVARVRQLAAKPKQTTTSSTSQTFNMKYPKLTALLTALEGGTAATQEEYDAVNAELAEAGVNAAGIFPRTLSGDLATANTSLEAANSRIETLTTEAEAATTKITNLTNENATLKAKVAQAPAAAAPAVGNEDPKTGKTDEEKRAETINALQHNQGILDNPLFMKF